MGYFLYDLHAEFYYDHHLFYHCLFCLTQSTKASKKNFNSPLVSSLIRLPSSSKNFPENLFIAISGFYIILTLQYSTVPLIEFWALIPPDIAALETIAAGFSLIGVSPLEIQS